MSQSGCHFVTDEVGRSLVGCQKSLLGFQLLIFIATIDPLDSLGYQHVGSLVATWKNASETGTEQLSTRHPTCSRSRKQSSMLV
jgi:hypothetical protein